jgi:hypothetical protein
MLHRPSQPYTFSARTVINERRRLWIHGVQSDPYTHIFLHALQLKTIEAENTFVCIYGCAKPRTEQSGCIVPPQNSHQQVFQRQVGTHGYRSLPGEHAAAGVAT